jgi:hypothetical protein
MFYRLVAAASLGFAVHAQPARKAPDYQREIRPILSDNCFHCHGPDSATRMAGLRIDRKEFAFEARKSGAAIVPGKPAESLLFRRISEQNPARRMPPPYAHKTLTAAQVELIKRWIEAGAPWQEHWAFQPPEKKQPPAVSNSAWVKTPVDRFILARLEREKLAPAPAAGRRTLIRRVALDLTGLPPKPAEIEQFLADLTPKAYENMVDRYLASPHYGEHRARYWLDAARYGDTHGIHIDNYREMWAWRDWVIQALNRNMPFDRFSIEQLAGDLLPEATLDQKIATGFQRNNVTTSEGGAIEDEYAEIYAKDRADTAGAVYLGLTVGCATCHDHKFDPITQKDFYALGAFFRHTPQPVMDGNVADTAPVLAVPRSEDRAAYDKLLAGVQELERKLAEARAAAPAAARGVPLFGPEDELAIADAGKPFTLSATFALDDVKKRTVLLSQTAAAENGRGWTLEVRNDEIAFRLTGDFGKSIEVRPRRPALQPKRRYHVAVSYDGSRAAAGLWMWLDGKLVAERGGPLRGEIVGGFPEKPAEFRHEGVESYKLYNRALSAAEAALLCQGGKADPREIWLLREYEPTRELHRQIREMQEEARVIASRGSVTHVMQELPGTPFAHVLHRGAYDQKRERVEAATPAVLPPMKSSMPRNRLGFAQWLFDPENPLTARVAVNRMWQEVFGTGLVKTADDFGNQGEPPVNQELLDWLAVDFRESGWDLKRFYKQLLMSAAYRQQAVTTPEKLAKDPDNRLLSRGPRFRMDAEVIRDYALAASGLLATKIGGPSVRPYQPEGVWEAVAMRESDTRFYKRGSGEDLYRRSMYTFWKRSAPPASMEIFNAPTRESCTVRRERTNTPLQALVTMNDVQFVEAARVLAERALQSSVSTDERLNYIAVRLLARPLTPFEKQVALGSLAAFDKHYKAHPEHAKALLGSGERPFDPSLEPAAYASWTMLANQLMNLDEVLTK